MVFKIFPILQFWIQKHKLKKMHQCAQLADNSTRYE